MPPLPRLVCLACCFLAVVPLAESAAEKFSTSAVFANVDKSYKRLKNADGTFQKEYYALTYGGQAQGTTTDKTIDRVSFATFDELLKKHLAGQNYLFAPDATSADLLLFINWGRTIPFNNGTYQQSVNTASQSMSALRATGANLNGGFGIPSLSPEQQAAADQAESDLMVMMMENRARDQANEANASLLGYIDDINKVVDSPVRWAGGGQAYDDMRGDIEEARYYILVYAYDFRRLVQHKEQKLLWVTRISIRAPGDQFDANLAGMLERAGRYFGRDSRGLVRRFEGTVEMGETKVIGVEGEDEGEGKDEATSAPKAETP
jgi:hypothetical protein